MQAGIEDLVACAQALTGPEGITRPSQLCLTAESAGAQATFSLIGVAHTAQCSTILGCRSALGSVQHSWMCANLGYESSVLPAPLEAPHAASIAPPSKQSE